MSRNEKKSKYIYQISKRIISSGLELCHNQKLYQIATIFIKLKQEVPELVHFQQIRNSGSAVTQPANQTRDWNFH